MDCLAGFDVARTGVASVGFIGFPSVGKSTLMSRLTGQHSEGKAYSSSKLNYEIMLIVNSCRLRIHHIDDRPRTSYV